MTNADRIRAMTDEEMAEYMRLVAGCGANHDHEYCRMRKDCGVGSECWLEWLQKEVQEH